VIGTHQLVNKNVVFKDLGLIVDEEQKFGVNVKDKLKTIAANVDVNFNSNANSKNIAVFTNGCA
jgi:transcription-repair coupling factor (superfamily II helicase)